MHNALSYIPVLLNSWEIVGIEVKVSSSVTAQDFKGLRALAEATGKRFHRGIVL